MNGIATQSLGGKGPLRLHGYLTVRPFKTIPEGSVQVQDSPAGPRPKGQINLPTLHSRSVS